MQHIIKRMDILTKIYTVAIIYFLLGKLGLYLALNDDDISIVWPAAGFALAAVLLYGPKILFGIWLGSFAVLSLKIGAFYYNPDAFLFVSYRDDSLFMPFMMACGAAGQAWVTHTILKRFFGLPLDIRTYVDLVKITIMAGPLASIVPVIFNMAALLLSDQATPNNIANNIALWIGHTFGVIIFAPIIMVSHYLPRIVLWRGKRVSSLSRVFIIVLLFPLAITLFAWRMTDNYVQEKNRTHFMLLVEENKNALINRIHSYELLLTVTKSYRLHEEEIILQDWQAYAGRLKMDTFFKGLRGVGFITDVSHEKYSQFLKDRKAEYGDKFVVHPQGDFPANFIITYIEPLEKNGPALGLNIAFEKDRREAAIYARNWGVTTLTRPITLVQDSEKTPGFLMLHPVFGGRYMDGENQQNHKNFLGWVYAPLIARDIMKDLTLSQGKTLRIRIYDSGAISDGAVYDSNPVINSPYKPSFIIKRDVQILQRIWNVEWQSTPDFDSAMVSYEPDMVLIGGISFTVVLSIVLFILSRRTAIIQGIVDQKVEELRYHKDQLHLIFDNFPGRIWYKDDKNTILRLNKKAAMFMGGEVEEFEGRNTYEIFPQMAKQYHDDDLDVLRTGIARIGKVEKFIPVKGKPGWVEITKIPLTDPVTGERTLLVVADDITTRTESEEALRKSEELNKLVIRGLSAGVWDWDIASGKIYISERLRDILKWHGRGMTISYEELLQELHADDLAHVESQIEQHFKTRNIYDIEYRILDGENEYRWVHVCGQASWDQDGQVVRMVGSLTDITNRKQSEEELVRSNLELERFAYIASHDLQEPVRLIRNFSSLLSEEYGATLQAEAKEYLKFILRGAVSIQEIVEDLLEYSRAGQTESVIEGVDMNLIMTRVVENLKPVIIESGGYITYDGLPVVNGNPVRLARLLQNLIGNGLKYRKPNVPPEIHIMAEDMGAEWLFSVSDNGIGIREEYLEQIFIIFKRLHNRSEYLGTGIGLAICKKIVEGFGGRIWAESRYGEGTDFLFTLPKIIVKPNVGEE